MADNLYDVLDEGDRRRFLLALGFNAEDDSEEEQRNFLSSYDVDDVELARRLGAV